MYTSKHVCRTVQLPCGFSSDYDCSSNTKARGIAFGGHIRLN